MSAHPGHEPVVRGQPDRLRDLFAGAPRPQHVEAALVVEGVDLADRTALAGEGKVEVVGAARGPQAVRL